MHPEQHYRNADQRYEVHSQQYRLRQYFSHAGRLGNGWWAWVGIEPPTSAVLQRRSTDELHARLVKTLAAKGDGQGLAKYTQSNIRRPQLCVRGRDPKNIVLNRRRNKSRSN